MALWWQEEVTLLAHISVSQRQRKGILTQLSPFSPFMQPENSVHFVSPPSILSGKVLPDMPKGMPYWCLQVVLFPTKLTVTFSHYGPVFIFKHLLVSFSCHVIIHLTIVNLPVTPTRFFLSGNHFPNA